MNQGRGSASTVPTTGVCARVWQPCRGPITAHREDGEALVGRLLDLLDHLSARRTATRDSLTKSLKQRGRPRTAGRLRLRLRVYFVQRGDVLVILLCGGDKRTQISDIKRAKELAADL